MPIHLLAQHLLLRRRAKMAEPRLATPPRHPFLVQTRVIRLVPRGASPTTRAALLSRCAPTNPMKMICQGIRRWLLCRISLAVIPFLIRCVLATWSTILGAVQTQPRLRATTSSKPEVRQVCGKTTPSRAGNYLPKCTWTANGRALNTGRCAVLASARSGRVSSATYA